MDLTKAKYISNWKNSKLETLAKNLTSFFVYLTEDRDGFLRVSFDNSFDTIEPSITMNMANELIKEIYPCSSVSNSMRFTTSKIEPQDKQLILSTMKRNLPDSLRQIDIPNIVPQILWTYVDAIIKEQSYDPISKTFSDTRFQDNIELNQIANFERRSFTFNWGLDNDLLNTAFQGLLYIIVALTDWLEVDVVSRAEVRTAWSIGADRDPNELVPSRDETLINTISLALLRVNLTADNRGLSLFAGAMEIINRETRDMPRDPEDVRGKNKKLFTMVNRLCSFCQPV